MGNIKITRILFFIFNKHLHNWIFNLIFYIYMYFKMNYKQGDINIIFFYKKKVII